MTPTDHTSTLLEIFGGSLPTTKHSGGRYLEETELGLECVKCAISKSSYPTIQIRQCKKASIILSSLFVSVEFAAFGFYSIVFTRLNFPRGGFDPDLTSTSPLPGRSAPSRLQGCSCRRPWSWTGRSPLSLSPHRQCRLPAGCYLSTETREGWANVLTPANICDPSHRNEDEV